MAYYPSTIPSSKGSTSVYISYYLKFPLPSIYYYSYIKLVLIQGSSS